MKNPFKSKSYIFQLKDTKEDAWNRLKNLTSPKSLFWFLNNQRAFVGKVENNCFNLSSPGKFGNCYIMKGHYDDKNNMGRLDIRYNWKFQLYYISWYIICISSYFYFTWDSYSKGENTDFTLPIVFTGILVAWIVAFSSKYKKSYNKAIIDLIPILGIGSFKENS